MTTESGNKVFVGGISWKADEKSLAEFFATFGPVIECKIIMDKVTNKSKGYGFVTFEDAESAEKVKQSPNLYFLGKTMNVGDAVRKNENKNERHNQQQQSFVQPFMQGYNPYNAYPYNPNFYPQQQQFMGTPYVSYGQPYPFSPQSQPFTPVQATRKHHWPTHYANTSNGTRQPE